MRLDLSNRLPLAFALLDLEAVFPIQLTYIGLEMTHFSLPPCEIIIWYLVSKQIKKYLCADTLVILLFSKSVPLIVALE